MVAVVHKRRFAFAGSVWMKWVYRVLTSVAVLGCVGAAGWAVFALGWLPVGLELVLAVALGGAYIVFVVHAMIYSHGVTRAGVVTNIVLFVVGSTAFYIWIVGPALEGAMGREARTKQIPTDSSGAWDGFGDVRWGAHADDISGLRLLRRDGLDAVYTRVDEKWAVGEEDIVVTYSFYRGVLWKISFSCFPRHSSIERFKEVAIARYGCLDTGMRLGGGKEVWKSSGHSSDGGGVQLSAVFSDVDGNVWMRYMPLEVQYARKQQRAASNSRPTTRAQR